jgi:hypothetical protein
MRLSIAEGSTSRAAFFGALFIALLVIPTTLGFAVASAGDSRPPDPAQVQILEPPSAGDATTSATDQQEVVSQVPIGDAPSTAQEALTRQDENVAGIPRLRYITPATGEVRIDNGDIVPLGNDVLMTVNVSPFPTDQFQVDIELIITHNDLPVTDAVIDTTWDMIVMGHGPFLSHIPHTSDGTYVVSYDFFMFGPWQIDTDLKIPGIDPIDFSLSIYVWPT